MSQTRYPSAPINWLSVSQVMFYFLAIVWVLLAVVTALLMAGVATGYGLAFGGLMLSNAAALALAGFGLKFPHRIFYFYALFVLLVNVLLSVTDQVGLLDVATLLVDMAIWAILIIQRNAIPAWRRTRSQK